MQLYILTPQSFGGVNVIDRPTEHEIREAFGMLLAQLQAKSVLPRAHEGRGLVSSRMRNMIFVCLDPPYQPGICATGTCI